MSRYNRYPVSGMTNVHKNIYRNGSNSIPRYYYIPVYRPPLFVTHVCVSTFGQCVVCAHIPNEVGEGRGVHMQIQTLIRRFMPH